MKWFRWYHDTCADTKLTLIARKTGQSKTTVIAVWAYLLEEASKADVRGQLISLDLEEASVALEVNIEALEAIYAEMQNREMIVDFEIQNWSKRQPKSDSDEAERARRYREKLKITEPSRYREETEKSREEQNNGAFDKFWSVYPRKTAKAYARGIWERKRLSSKLPEILRGVEMYTRTEQWKNPALIPHASTFLNQERWLDELSEAGTPVGKKTYAQRVQESPLVHVTVDGITMSVQGHELVWDDVAKVYHWRGQRLFVDQVRIPEGISA